MYEMLKKLCVSIEILFFTESSFPRLLSISEFCGDRGQKSAYKPKKKILWRRYRLRNVT